MPAGTSEAPLGCHALSAGLLPAHGPGVDAASASHHAPQPSKACEGAWDGSHIPGLVALASHALARGGGELAALEHVLGTETAAGAGGAVFVRQLGRALQAAQDGDPDRAKCIAAEALGLVRMAARLRASLLLSAAEGGHADEPADSDCSCDSAAAPTGRKRAAPGADADAGAGSDCSSRGRAASSGGGCAAAAAPPPKRRRADDMPPPAPRRPPPRRGSSSASITSAPPPAPAAPGAPPAFAPWRGRLLHAAPAPAAPRAAPVELGSLCIQVPLAFRPHMPRDLTAVSLAPRRAVPLGRHVVCRTALAHAGPAAAAAAALAAMAAAELVAVAPLAAGEMVVVPYHDGAGALRVVCFLRVPGG
ncbi:MAG: hypothetical protein J3K34DRAFT_457653 [Monoraphidium minutum]|nr:MAG: hypothetical protein J3K34DRAFT_457653 [Monoraphidium minutum]